MRKGATWFSQQVEGQPGLSNAGDSDYIGQYLYYDSDIVLYLIN